MPRHVSDEEISKMHLMKKAGIPDKQIAELLGRNRGSIWKHLYHRDKPRQQSAGAVVARALPVLTMLTNTAATIPDTVEDAPTELQQMRLHIFDMLLGQSMGQNMDELILAAKSVERWVRGV